MNLLRHSADDLRLGGNSQASINVMRVYAVPTDCNREGKSDGSLRLLLGIAHW